MWDVVKVEEACSTNKVFPFGAAASSTKPPWAGGAWPCRVTTALPKPWLWFWLPKTWGRRSSRPGGPIRCSKYQGKGKMLFLLPWCSGRRGGIAWSVCCGESPCETSLQPTSLQATPRSRNCDVMFPTDHPSSPRLSSQPGRCPDTILELSFKPKLSSRSSFPTGLCFAILPHAEYPLPQGRV